MLAACAALTACCMYVCGCVCGCVAVVVCVWLWLWLCTRQGVVRVTSEASAASWKCWSAQCGLPTWSSPRPLDHTTPMLQSLPLHLTIPRTSRPAVQQVQPVQEVALALTAAAAVLIHPPKIAHNVTLLVTPTPVAVTRQMQQVCWQA